MSALYRDRQEWADITPISQHEPDENPIAPIFYSETYKDATDYFRGVVRAQEMSERVLTLTESIIRMNPAHYSAWQYRYGTLIAINAPLDDELELMDELAEKYLKNYQVWHHRRLLLQRGALTKTPAAELAFIARGLSHDAKNYHTWSYRQWVLAYFNQDKLWGGELRYIENMLEDDVRNNSAWHHRFFVVFSSGVRKGEEDREEVVRRELTFTKDKIALAPNNASAWNYLRGVLEHSGTPFSLLTGFVLPYTVSVQSSDGREDEKILDLENPRPSPGADLPCPAAIEFLADIYEASGGEEISKAIELWKSLANDHDTIRKKYWEHRILEVPVSSYS
ncbi:farnesyltransferase [Fomitiporia mediterranea MF3/22]|uniref:farnesyltransferase n=1 Tax=Fomitiporia mediterranea (strain MF3/22) TaxID=694068 RepID=UPI0004407399|nr:farnesyltransferase [Fomitiporia mediterranea MF3/22]EJC98263.1 farnesyltransferase [Fomitiporia mediterranea MF3/22]